MAKLSKAQAKAHAAACEMLQQDTLSDDDKQFVLANWQESATHINSAAGAFFTPLDLARSFAIEVPPGRIVDLCAGIGCLAYAVSLHHELRPVALTCIEINPDYAEVGRKIVPQADWLVADALAVVDLGLGRFDAAIGNPPYGAIKRQRSGPRYGAQHFEYHIIDVAADVADYGVFIVPHLSAGFRYSGADRFVRDLDGKAKDFERVTGLEIEANCGIDTSFARGLWRGAAPKTEIITVDFAAARARRRPAQADFFAEAAE